MYIDSASSIEVENLLDWGIFKGVTTNPTLLKKEEGELISNLNKLLSYDIPTLFIQLTGSTEKEMLASFNLYQDEINDTDRIIYKIPINEVGIKVIKKIKLTNPSIRFLGTAIYSVDQLIVAALSGCEFVAPYVNRMIVEGINPYEVIEQGSQFIKKRKLNCQIMGASFKNSKQVTKALSYGADTVTISKEIAEQLVSKKASEFAISVFNNEI